MTSNSKDEIEKCPCGEKLRKIIFSRNQEDIGRSVCFACGRVYEKEVVVWQIKTTGENQA